MAFAAFVDPSVTLLNQAIAAGARLMFVGDIQLVTSKQLREQRAGLATENGKVLARIGAEKDGAREGARDRVGQARRRHPGARQEDLPCGAAGIARRRSRKPVHERRSGRDLGRRGVRSAEEKLEQARVPRCFFKYLRYGKENLNAGRARHAAAGFRSQETRGVIDDGARDGLSTTNAAGGYTIPALFFSELQNSLLAFGGAREMARVLTTDSGQSLPIPTVDDTANKAQIVSEGSSLTSPNDVTFGQVAIPTFMYRSVMPITFELLQDSAFDMEAWIREAQMTVRLGRGTTRTSPPATAPRSRRASSPASSSGKTATSATSVSFPTTSST
jgi:HK97 family phage major capsid protein